MSAEEHLDDNHGTSKEIIGVYFSPKKLNIPKPAILDRTKKTLINVSNDRINMIEKIELTEQQDTKTNPITKIVEPFLDENQKKTVKSIENKPNKDGFGNVKTYKLKKKINTMDLIALEELKNRLPNSSTISQLTNKIKFKSKSLEYANIKHHILNNISDKRKDKLTSVESKPREFSNSPGEYSEHPGLSYTFYRKTSTNKIPLKRQQIRELQKQLQKSPELQQPIQQKPLQEYISSGSTTPIIKPLNNTTPKETIAKNPNQNRYTYDPINTRKEETSGHIRAITAKKLLNTN